MLDRKIILIGYSGHGFVVADAAILSNLALKYYAEKESVRSNPYGLDYLGFEADEDFEGWNTEDQYILGIGDNRIRQKVGKLIFLKNKDLLNVIHPSSRISAKHVMGSGNFIAKNVSINPLVTIGDFCIVNTGAIVEHECTIGDAVHIAPGAVLAGNVKVGDFSFIGANSVIKQGITIGSNVTIGAGSVIINDVGNDKKVVGNPGRII